MTFTEFQELNARRSRETWQHDVSNSGQDSPWPWQNWALCVAGEAGELCNLTKKVLRGDFPLTDAKADLLRELADIITYADLMISSLNASTENVVLSKFREVSHRLGWTDDGHASCLPDL